MISNTQQNIVKYLKITFNIRLNTPITFFNVQLNIFKYFSYPAEYLQISKNNIQYSIRYPNHFLQYPTKRFQIFQLPSHAGCRICQALRAYFESVCTLHMTKVCPRFQIIPFQGLYLAKICILYLHLAINSAFVHSERICLSLRLAKS